MSRKETESEQEVAAKWKKVSKVKAAYNDSLLPAGGAKPDTPTSGSDSAATRKMRSNTK